MAKLFQPTDDCRLQITLGVQLCVQDEGRLSEAASRGPSASFDIALFSLLSTCLLCLLKNSYANSLLLTVFRVKKN